MRHEVTSELIEAVYERNIRFSSPEAVNDPVILVDEFNASHSALCRKLPDQRLQRVRSRAINGLQARDALQHVFVDCLLDDSVLVNIATGSAGTGKTTLALNYAAQQFLERKRRIFLCKPTVMVGSNNAFGPVPGDIAEKYDPYLASYKIVLNKAFPSAAYVERMIAAGDIQYIPLELARGCTFDDCTFILDEAQNLHWHELNTIITRIGMNAKAVILGDLNQIDIPLHASATGLSKLINSRVFQDSAIASHVELYTQYRSPICQLMTQVNESFAR